MAMKADGDDCLTDSYKVIMNEKQLKEFCFYCTTKHPFYHEWMKSIRLSIDKHGLARATVHCLVAAYREATGLSYYDYDCDRLAGKLIEISKG
jgi:hypothetical protein